MTPDDPRDIPDIQSNVQFINLGEEGRKGGHLE